MHTQIYLVLTLLTLLSPLAAAKTAVYHPPFETRCPQDPFDTRFFYHDYKISHNTTFSPESRHVITEQESLSTTSEPTQADSKAIPTEPPQNFANKIVNGIGGFFKRIPDTISSGAQQVGNAVKGITKTVADGTKEAGSKATGFVASNIAKGVNTIKAKTEDISQSISQSISQKAQSGWEAIKSAPKAVVNTVSSIGEKAKEAPKKVMNEAANVGEKVVNLSKKVANCVKEAGKKAKDLVVNGMTGGVNKIKEKTKDVPGKISETAKQGWEKMKEVPKTVVNAVGSVGEKAKNVIQNDIPNTARNLGGKIKNTVSETTYKIFENLKKIPSKAVEGVSSAKDKVKNLIIPEGTGSKIKDFFKSIPEKTVDKLKTMKNYLGEKKDNVVESLKENKNKIFSKAKEGVKSAVGGATGMLGLIWGGFGWAFSSVKDTLMKIIMVALFILGLYVFIQIRPFLIFILDILSLFRCKKRSTAAEPRKPVEATKEAPVKSKEKEKINKEDKVKEPVKLNKEDFEMECISLKADKIPKDESLNFLRFHLHYEIKHFPTMHGEVVVKFTTMLSNTVKQSAVFRVPAEEFVCKSVWDGCSFQDPISKYTEDVDVRVCVDFKSQSGQYFSICSKTFKVMLV